MRNLQDVIQDDIDRETALYNFIGKYLIIFQWVESQLDQILLLGLGVENWSDTHKKLTGMRNVDKIEATLSLVLSGSLYEKRNGLVGWNKQFEELVKRLRKEGRRRNSLVHSQYLFDFVEAGLPPLRSNRTKKAGELCLDQEYFDQSNTDKILKEISELAWDLGRARLQLVAWHP